MPQGDPERRHAQQLSLKRGRPPVAVPGYEPERLIGTGAYGEVWLAIQSNTGRRVAIKFYAHRGGLDWSLLSREVEKLTFLFADRYVVQLIGVGWDADPPYYIMEYLERGSLAQRIEQGRIAVEEAVEVFRDVCVGLVHAHGKGVLHCDLKPANVLLDQDGKPRLADFGQSRLSNEQAPALGTLFYMAPEQADLRAMPDARWDVYALGALMYSMLVGRPPHRTATNVETLEKTVELGRRLTQYRRIIRNSPPPTEHRKVPGVDRALADIIDRCIAGNPRRRFPNVQAVRAALEARAAQRARRPMLLTGIVAPVLLLVVVSLFAWRGFHAAVSQSDAALTERALESNQFAAQFVARTAAHELERRLEAVEQLAASKDLRKLLADTLDDAEFQALLRELSTPADDEAAKQRLAALRQSFVDSPLREELQRAFEDAIPPSLRPETTTPSTEEDDASAQDLAAATSDDDTNRPDGDTSMVASWFYCDPHGISTVRVPQSPTIGKNFAWRSFFCGGTDDHAPDWRPGPDEHVTKTHMSGVFLSQATQHWILAVSTPVYDVDDPDRFLGVVALTLELGRFVALAEGTGQFPVLIDMRPGDRQGVILQHPLLGEIIEQTGELPKRFEDYRVTRDELPLTKARQRDYADPLAADEFGGDYRRDWLAAVQEVDVRHRPTGFFVVVQEAYDSAIGSTLDRLRAGLVRYGASALALVAFVLVGVWVFAMAVFERTRGKLVAGRSDPDSGSGSGTGTGLITPASAGSSSVQNTETLKQR